MLNNPVTPSPAVRDPEHLERLTGVHPALVTAVQTVVLRFPMFVVQGVRTAEQQQRLWRQGRSTPGPVVTNCDGFHTRSNHQPHADGLGYAVDLAFLPTDELPDPFDLRHPWQAYGLLGESLGLIWGGRFKLRDYDHLELSSAIPAQITPKAA